MFRLLSDHHTRFWKCGVACEKIKVWLLSRNKYTPLSVIFVPNSEVSLFYKTSMNYDGDDFPIHRKLNRNLRNVSFIYQLILGGVVTGFIMMQQQYRQQLMDALSLVIFDSSGNDCYLKSDVCNRLKQRWSSVRKIIRGIKFDIGKIIFKDIVVKALSDGTLYENPECGVVDSSEKKMLDIRRKYEKEMDRLKNENEQLRQFIISCEFSEFSLADTYSNILDEIKEYCNSFEQQIDILPKIIVIGDYMGMSIIETVAPIPIFPSKIDKMEIPVPIKLTLSENPHHLAQIKGNQKVFDLNNELDVLNFRKEVDLKINKLSTNETEDDEISINIKGPGLKSVVIVDLSGIIKSNTNQDINIYEMIKHYTLNPNVVVLCIQPSEMDSTVNDLLKQYNLHEKQTIFLYEGNENIVRMKMNKSSIKSIQHNEYQKHCGIHSELDRDSASGLFQLSFENFNSAMSELFWNIVRENIKYQVDLIKARQVELEFEWINNFQRSRLLDRSELLYKAENEIFDIICSCDINVKYCEERLTKLLWNKISNSLFDEDFLYSTKPSNGGFNNNANTQFMLWVEQKLPRISLKIALEVLQYEIENLLQDNGIQQANQPVFDQLKKIVVDEAMKRHEWEEKIYDVLRNAQLSVFSNDIIDDVQWNAAVQFSDSSVKEKLKDINGKLKLLLGPSAIERWVFWKYLNEEQKQRNLVKYELDKIIAHDSDKTILTDIDLTLIRNSLQRSGITCSDEFIIATWELLYKRYFFNAVLSKIEYYKKYPYLRKRKTDFQEYNEVIFFSKIQQVLEITVNFLLQEIVNREVPQMYEKIKEVLEEFKVDESKKKLLITGRRVTLAEELKCNKNLQKKLNKFIEELNKKR